MLRVLLVCMTGLQDPSCLCGLALTGIAGTRVMVGVDASFVAAPNGGPGFLAAGTCLVKRGEASESLLKSPALKFYKQAPVPCNGPLN